MEFIILTIFPQIFPSYFQESLMAKAIKKKIVKITIKDIREYSQDKHQKVDDRPYGGGPGMLLKLPPIIYCLHSLKRKKRSRVILLDPKGRQFNQAQAKKYAYLDQLILICGRYEGIDERIKNFVDEVISVGPYILNGGEIAALTIIETTSRLLKGFVGDPKSLSEESYNFKDKKLEYPQYTRPALFKAGKKKYPVPKILLSGDHRKIKDWRKNTKS